MGFLFFIQHEEGRIIQEPNDSFTYQYHLKDHLGNTRSTFTTGEYTSGYLATFEDATYTQDTTDFFNVDPRVPYPVGGKAVRLNSAAPIGPGFATAVSRGDTISMSVKAYYEDISGYGTSPVAVANIAAALTTAFGGVDGAGASEGQQAIYDIFNNDPAVTSALLSGNSNSDSYPSAYLNYLLFDSDNTIVDAGYFGVEEGANLEQTISVSDLIIDRAGFIYIYLSNESNSSNYVFFDNLDVAISESPVLETTDYYPFGLAFNSYTKPGTVDQNFKYNGKELVADLDLGWYDYQTRYYDPTLGKWHTVDLAADLMRRHSPYNYAFDNPIRFIDPDGMIPEDDKKNKNNGNNSQTIHEKRVELDSQNKKIADDKVTISPVKDPVISSEQNPNRVHPVTGKARPHKGIDIVDVDGSSASEGKDIVAPANGKILVVKSKDDSDGAGNRVHMKDNRGNKHSFFHLQDNSTAVSNNQVVKRGETIGKIGNTGTSTASHLHYEVRDSNGAVLNPRDANSGLKNAPTKTQAKQMQAVQRRQNAIEQKRMRTPGHSSIHF
ncbi:peptidoglycan DD-metalloendopeptidase family protein [Reichenbachiella sp. MALMAid0571]|uniref:peptidoglycan DD-metalloendopeptidase family protein n=1 Tax=Reichenbachiella sp. MALMAid0571 TaxID=3143939 RepID=UPI0032DEC14A